MEETEAVTAEEEEDQGEDTVTLDMEITEDRVEDVTAAMAVVDKSMDPITAVTAIVTITESMTITPEIITRNSENHLRLQVFISILSFIVSGFHLDIYLL